MVRLTKRIKASKMQTNFRDKIMLIKTNKNSVRVNHPYVGRKRMLMPFSGEYYTEWRRVKFNSVRRRRRRRRDEFVRWRFLLEIQLLKLIRVKYIIYLFFILIFTFLRSDVLEREIKIVIHTRAFCGLCSSYFHT